MSLEVILCIVIIAMLAAIIVLIFLLRKKPVSSGNEDISEQLDRYAQLQRESVNRQIAAGASEQFQRFGVIQESVQLTLSTSRSEQTNQMHGFSQQIDRRLAEAQSQTLQSLQSNREEQSKKLSELQQSLENQLLAIRRDNAANIQKVNETLESKMKLLQESNEKRLEQMQGVVDEKLQSTLESRLSKAFELVTSQLAGVQKGLGEMQSLAADARSLKNALTNVKERGTYGEVRLEKLLSDILTPAQYGTNVEITSGKRVEFAVYLPGKGDDPLLLPIDSKFPVEDFARLLDAEDKPSIENARKALLAKIRIFAKEIHDKYIVPPKTTDFALMFLPTEGLYAEVVQNVALFEELRDKYKITAVGATTLSAYLSSLQMGFKTLVIEKRSQEVWDRLREAKKAFDDFEKLLDVAHKQIQTADNTIEKIVGVRTRAINRALKEVQEEGGIERQKPQSGHLDIEDAV